MTLIIVFSFAYVFACNAGDLMAGDYKYYKVIYKQLPTYRFYKYHDQVWIDPSGKSAFVWFLDRNDFCITKGRYIHNALFTWGSPYSAYWLIKYRRWFKENCKPENIEK